MAQQDRRLINQSVRHIRDVMNNLRAKGSQMEQAAKAALKTGIDRIVEDAKSRCPVKTGKLRESIKAIPIADGAIYKITASAKNEKGVPYAAIVEYSPIINKPFLYPAIELNRSRLHNEIKAALQNAISQ